MSLRSSTGMAIAMVDEIRSCLENDDLDNANVRATLLKRIFDLQATVETPAEAILRIYHQPMQNAALRIAVEKGLLRDLCNDIPISFGEPANDDTDLNYRVLRVLSAMGIVTEGSEPSSTTEGQQFRPTPLAEALTTPAFEGGVKFLYDTTIPTLAKLGHFLESGPNIGLMAKKFNSFKTPFDFAFGLPMFDYLKANPELSFAFDALMAGRYLGKPSWLDYYPMEQRLIDGTNKDPKSIFLIDLGGGRGHNLFALAEKWPALSGRLVLQETAEIIAEVESSQLGLTYVQNGDTSEPESLANVGPFSSSSKCTKLPFITSQHDFFTPQPIRGARVYHLRAILHDWPTASCRTILAHIASAMEPGYSKLIIHDFVLPEKNVPLFAACNDMLLMVLLGGKDRTEKQMRELLASVGLEVTGIWVPQGWEEGVVEVMKVKEVTNGVGVNAHCEKQDEQMFQERIPQSQLDYSLEV